MGRYVALLRGINVGGNNIISMASLRTCFEESGFANVSTYIQSGNVLFETSEGRAAEHVRAVEEALSETYKADISVVLRSREQMERIVADAPKGFGGDPATYRYDVVFLKEPLTARQAMKDVSIKEGVDAATAGKGVLYFSRLASRATQSRLNKVASARSYKQMTIRNWNTTVKLAALLQD